MKEERENVMNHRRPLVSLCSGLDKDNVEYRSNIEPDKDNAAHRSNIRTDKDNAAHSWNEYLSLQR